MKFNTKTPRTAMTLGEVTLQVPQPFEEGHTCTANEAAVLNQTLRENAANNLRKKIEGKSADESQTMLDEYLAGYEFGVRQGSGPRLNPVDAEALREAKERVKDAIRNSGKYKLADFTTKKITEMAQEYLKANPDVRAQAEKTIAARSKVGEDLLKGIDVGGEAPAAAADG